MQDDGINNEIYNRKVIKKKKTNSRKIKKDGINESMGPPYQNQVSLTTMCYV